MHRFDFLANIHSVRWEGGVFPAPTINGESFLTTEKRLSTKCRTQRFHDTLLAVHLVRNFSLKSPLLSATLLMDHPESFSYQHQNMATITDSSLNFRDESVLAAASEEPSNIFKMFDGSSDADLSNFISFLDNVSLRGKPEEKRPPSFSYNVRRRHLTIPMKILPTIEA